MVTCPFIVIGKFLFSPSYKKKKKQHSSRVFVMDFWCIHKVNIALGFCNAGNFALPVQFAFAVNGVIMVGKAP